MRLFCGIEIPDGIKAGLRALTEGLKPLAPLAWSPIENLHVTTKFIGEWPEERIEEVKRVLGRVRRPATVEIGVRGLGWFPNERNPRVLWAGIEAGDELSRLARDTERSVAELGVAAEEHEFHPHLTLARRRNPIPIDRLRKEVAGKASSDFGSFRAESFFLYLSKGGRYIKLEECPLA
jgi:2'-5' RNA ligase